MAVMSQMWQWELWGFSTAVQECCCLFLHVSSKDDETQSTANGLVTYSIAGGTLQHQDECKGNGKGWGKNNYKVIGIITSISERTWKNEKNTREARLDMKTSRGGNALERSKICVELKMKGHKMSPITSSHYLELLNMQQLNIILLTIGELQDPVTRGHIYLSVLRLDASWFLFFSLLSSLFWSPQTPGGQHL